MQGDSELADEEIQRAMEFMIQHQAQYTARLERDEARLARLEESFTLLVELARVADERQDTRDARQDMMDERQNTMLETMATLSQAMNDLVKRTITDEMRIVRLEDALTRLAELAHKHE